MKSDFSHIPAHKQDELKFICRKARNVCKIEFIILFGSYARGDFVERDVTYAKGLGYPEEFRSDFDIIIILKSREFLNQFYMKLNAFEDMLNKKYAKGELTTPVSLLFYSIDEVNDLLEKEANPFLKDVTEQGISLYNSGRYELSKAHKINTKQKRELAQQYFDHWFEKANISFKDFSFNLKEQHYNQSAFHLHQTTEACLNSVLLVHSFYSPKAHDIKKFLDLTERFDKSINQTFSRKTDEEKRLFELLRASYVDARYSPAFQITEGELKQIAEWVKNLLELTEQLCSQKIEQYK